MTRSDEIPDDATGDVLRGMLAGGDPLTSPRDINFSVVFPTERAAIAFCERVALEGFVLRYEKSDADELLPWDVTATNHMVPRYRDIVAVEDQLLSLAQLLGGDIDGWGCFSIEDGQSE
jgi:regulator of RNase E activity RraB